MTLDFQPEEQAIDFAPLSDAELAEIAKQEKFESFPAQVRTFAESTARSGTFGLSDLVQTKLLDVDPQDIKERQERNPIASTAGTVAGIAGSALIPGGGLVGLASRGAAATGKAVAGQIANKALGTVASKVVGSAVQGTLFGAGNVVSEHALGDPELTAQSAAAQIGLSAVLTGALGGLIGGAELSKPYLKAGMNKASELGKDAFSEAASFISGKDAGLIKKAIHKGVEALSDAEKVALENTTNQGLLNFASGLGIGHFLGVPKTVAGGVVAVIDALRNPLLTAQRLEKVEGLISRTSSQISSSTNKFLSSTNFEPLTSKLIADASEPTSYTDTEKSFEKRIQKIEEMTATPEGLLMVMDKSTDSLYSAAPEMTGQIQATMVAGLEFLASKVPKSRNETPLAPKYVPPKSEVMRFQHYYDIVEKPLRALNELNEGTLSLDTIEVLQNVYPRLYGQMKETLLDKLTTRKDKLPYRKRILLSQFLQSPMDESLLPQNIMAAQLTYQMPSQKSSGMVAPSGGARSLSKLNVASRAMTPIDRVSSRDKP